MKVGVRVVTSCSEDRLVTHHQHRTFHGLNHRYIDQRHPRVSAHDDIFFFFFYRHQHGNHDAEQKRKKVPPETRKVSEGNLADSYHSRNSCEMTAWSGLSVCLGAKHTGRQTTQLCLSNSVRKSYFLWICQAPYREDLLSNVKQKEESFFKIIFMSKITLKKCIFVS